MICHSDKTSQNPGMEINNKEDMIKKSYLAT